MEEEPYVMLRHHGKLTIRAVSEERPLVITMIGDPHHPGPLPTQEKVHRDHWHLWWQARSR